MSLAPAPRDWPSRHCCSTPLKGYLAVAHVFFFASHDPANLPDYGAHIGVHPRSARGFLRHPRTHVSCMAALQGRQGCRDRCRSVPRPRTSGRRCRARCVRGNRCDHSLRLAGQHRRSSAFPFAAWWLNPQTRSAAIMFFISASSLLIIVRHKDNIRRLMAGNENRFGGGKSGAA